VLNLRFYTKTTKVAVDCGRRLKRELAKFVTQELSEFITLNFLISDFSMPSVLAIDYKK